MTNYKEKLMELGFSRVEMDAIQLVLARMCLLPPCYDRPKFVACYEEDSDESVNEARWRKLLRELGFRSEAIALIEYAFSDDEAGRC